MDKSLNEKAKYCNELLRKIYPKELDMTESDIGDICEKWNDEFDNRWIYERLLMNYLGVFKFSDIVSSLGFGVRGLMIDPFKLEELIDSCIKSYEEELKGGLNNG